MMTPDEISAAINAAIADAYERGFSEGKQSAQQAVLVAIASALPVAGAGSTLLTQPESGNTGEAKESAEQAEGGETRSAKRAPRGLTDTVLRQVMHEIVALPMAEVQRRATEVDSRVSAKTVYNTLYRSTDYVREDDGRWRLRRASEIGQLKLIEPPSERQPEEAPATTH